MVSKCLFDAEKFSTPVVSAELKPMTMRRRLLLLKACTISSLFTMAGRVLIRSSCATWVSFSSLQAYHTKRMR